MRPDDPLSRLPASTLLRAHAGESCGRLRNIRCESFIHAGAAIRWTGRQAPASRFRSGAPTSEGFDDAVVSESAPAEFAQGGQGSPRPSLRTTGRLHIVQVSVSARRSERSQGCDRPRCFVKQCFNFNVRHVARGCIAQASKEIIQMLVECNHEGRIR